MMNTFAAARWPALALLCLALSGCLLSRQSTPVTVLAPTVRVEPDPAWPAVDWSLQVYRPRADAMRDSARVLVRPAPSQLQVYKGAAWLASAPDLVQSVLLHAFEDSGRIGAVVPAGAVRGRYALHSELRRFEAVDDGSGRLGVEVELQVKLVLVRNAQVLASASLSQRLEADGKGLPALTRAFEQALTALSVEVIGWTLAQGQAAEVAAAAEAPPSAR